MTRSFHVRFSMGPIRAMVDLNEIDSNNWSKLAAHLSKVQPSEDRAPERDRHHDELWRPTVQTQRRFTSEEETAVVADYRAGGTVYTLAEKYGCHRNTISRILKSHRVKLANAPIDSTKIDEIVRLYESGLSMAATAERIGISARSVFNYLRRRGLPTRSVHSRSR